mmetsp:Transcript_13137/g.32086  ORF Transcript_13137/g.32086 Transcript_13137/m.32086 type:complete len:389 (-) Transcript_13137:360-1526(-)
MASLSGSAASAAQTGNHRPIASDLLITSGCSTYHEWINAVRDEDKRTHDARIARKILGAQVSLWQFLATRHRAPAPGEKMKGLPSDTRDIIYRFLGPVEFGWRTLDGRDLCSVSQSTRTEDTARAVAYYVDLAHAAAKAGLGEVQITQEDFNRAPKAARGRVAVPMNVIGTVLEKKKLKLFDSRGSEYGGWRDVAFPMTIRWGVRPEMHYSHLFYASDRNRVLERLNGRTEAEHQAGARVPNGSFTDLDLQVDCSSHDTCLPDPGVAAAFAKVMEAGLRAAVKWIEQKVLDSFGRGDLEFVLTEEMWEQADLKLPNGKPVPFFYRELQRDFKTKGVRGHLKARFCVFDCPAFITALDRKGLEVEPTYERDAHGDILELFPVTLALKDF